MPESQLILPLEEVLEKIDRMELNERRYKALKEKITYEDGSDGVTWAVLDWAVEVTSMSPDNLDAAIDQFLLGAD